MPQPVHFDRAGHALTKFYAGARNDYLAEGGTGGPQPFEQEWDSQELREACDVPGSTGSSFLESSAAMKQILEKEILASTLHNAHPACQGKARVGVF